MGILWFLKTGEAGSSDSIQDPPPEYWQVGEDRPLPVDVKAMVTNVDLDLEIADFTAAIDNAAAMVELAAAINSNRMDVTLTSAAEAALAELAAAITGGIMAVSPYNAGNPFITTQDCTLAATNYDIDVNTALARNGKFGFLKAASTNVGVVSAAFSYNGSTFTSFIGDINAGDSIDLDGMDVDTLRVKSTVAGDDVIVEVH